MQCLHVAALPAEAILDDASSAAKGIRHGEARIGEATVLRWRVAGPDIDIAWHRQMNPDLLVSAAAMMVIRHLDDDMA